MPNTLTGLGDLSSKTSRPVRPDPARGRRVGAAHIGAEGARAAGPGDRRRGQEGAGTRAEGDARSRRLQAARDLVSV